MRQPIFCGVRSYFVFLFFIAFLFFDFPKHTRQRRAIRAGRHNPGAGATQRTAGAWGMASSREMVAALGLEEKKNKDRAQSN